jgi:hypothetical protein
MSDHLNFTKPYYQTTLTIIGQQVLSQFVPLIFQNFLQIIGYLPRHSFHIRIQLLQIIRQPYELIQCPNLSQSINHLHINHQ